MFWRRGISDENDWLGKVACFVCWEATGVWESIVLASHVAPSIPSYLTSAETFWVRCDVNEACRK